MCIFLSHIEWPIKEGIELLGCPVKIREIVN